jgi:signal peptidase I
MSTIFILLLVLLLTYLATALFLWIGTRLVRMPQVSYWRTLVATFFMDLACLVTYFTFVSLWSTLEVPPLIATLVQSGASLLLSWLAIKMVLRTSPLQAIGSWLSTLIPSAGALALVFFVLRPHVVAAYITSSLSGAPTLIGPHQLGTCPHCGKSAAVPPDVLSFDQGKSPRQGMCLSCQRAGMVSDIDPTVRTADHILVNKLFQPRRWDLVAFRALEDPSVRHVKRLVGLPGEEVMIKEGAIWINGQKQEPPADIAGLTYSAAPPEWQGTSWGSPARPVRLGAAECFAIGDFSLQSLHSRMWGPLPQTNVEGVVTVIYWPPSRWRLVR